MRKKYSRSESTTYFRKFKVDHVRGIHHPKELSVNTAPNSAKWPPCHVKLLLVIFAIILNRWVILIYFLFYGHVKLLVVWPNLAHGGHCVLLPPKSKRTDFYDVKVEEINPQEIFRSSWKRSLAFPRHSRYISYT